MSIALGGEAARGTPSVLYAADLGGLDETIGETDAAGVRQHLVSHWRVWLLIVVAVVVVNEVVDRNFFDHREHIDGDFALAVVALLIGFFGSYLVGRRKPRGMV